MFLKSSYILIIIWVTVHLRTWKQSHHAIHSRDTTINWLICTKSLRSHFICLKYRWVPLVNQKLLALPEYHSPPQLLLGSYCSIFSFRCSLFVDHCLSSFIYGYWLPLCNWYLQAFLYNLHNAQKTNNNKKKKEEDHFTISRNMRCCTSKFTVFIGRFLLSCSV